MGISDDIVSKQTKQTHAPVFGSEIKEETKTQETKIDEFFNSNKEPDTMEEKEEKVQSSWTQRLPKIFLAVAFLCLIAFFGYKNYQSYITPANTNTSTTSSTLPTLNSTETTTPATTTTPTADTSTTPATETPAATPPASTTTPTTPSAPAAINKSTIKLEVLNGNGINGSAAAVKASLEKLGFSVSKLTNARNFNYAESIIYYKTGKQAEAELVKDALTGRTVTIQNSDSVAGSYDVVLVVGKK